jgi:hypothetical protein
MLRYPLTIELYKMVQAFYVEFNSSWHSFAALATTSFPTNIFGFDRGKVTDQITAHKMKS